jgi:hypothetical protein
MDITGNYPISAKAMIVSSCYARKCHPETCCCDDDEYALYQEVETKNYLGMTCGYHFTAVGWGTKEELTEFLQGLA